jgi:hypothetical protein
MCGIVRTSFIGSEQWHKGGDGRSFFMDIQLAWRWDWRRGGARNKLLIMSSAWRVKLRRDQR